MGKQSKGQSIMEYGIVFAIIVAMCAGMQVYIKRGLQGRYRDVVKETTSLVQQAVIDSGSSLQVLNQHEPVYSSSNTDDSYATVVSEIGGAGGSSNRIYPSRIGGTGGFSLALTNSEVHQSEQ
jgi:hypothetical protein